MGAITEVWAHRGASAYKAENSMEAFCLAIEQGADGIETDVHLTADDRILVTHDENLRRVSGADILIKTARYDEIKDLNIAAYRGEGEIARLPLLEDLLDLLKDKSLRLNIELKNAPIVYPHLEEKVLAAVRKFGMEDRVVYSSFNHYSIMELKKLSVGSELAFLYLEPYFEPWLYARRCGVAGLHPQQGNLGIPHYVESCHELGVAVRPWTVNTEEELRAALDSACDAVISNYPDVALRLRTEREKTERGEQSHER